MADAEDLKSSGPKGRAGSSPALGTNNIRRFEVVRCRYSGKIWNWGNSAGEDVTLLSRGHGGSR